VPTAVVRLVSFAQRAKDDRAWAVFKRRFRTEMNKPDPARLLDLLAALSRPSSVPRSTSGEHPVLDPKRQCGHLRRRHVTAKCGERPES
jgi:hypothetical protein